MEKKNLPYYLILLFLIVLLISHYQNIYGADAFQVIWMANALRNGALFSNNTWLISPFSYLGMYPFSHWPIGVPIILAFLINFLNFISTGIFTIKEAVLVLDIIVILISYKSARILGNTLFKKEEYRILFVLTFLLSQYILDATVMTVSTRIFITIIMTFLITINLKILNKSISKTRAIIFILLLLFCGALLHKLWLATIISIICLMITLIIKKSKTLKNMILFLLLPLSILFFFIGLGFFSSLDYNFLDRLDPNQFFKSFLNENSLIGIGILLSWFYLWNSGLIIIFLPIGVLSTMFELIKFNKRSNKTIKNFKNNYKILPKLYLLLFILPFSFLLSATFYSIVLIFPIIIVFSTYGLIYLKKFISKFSNPLSWFLLITILVFSVIFSFLKVSVSAKINLWYVDFFIIFTIILVIFLSILNKSKNFLFIFYRKKINKNIWFLLLIFSIIIFSLTNIETNRAGLSNNPLPWKDECLTSEENEIIGFLQHEEINGLIFTIGITSNRIASIGFLPAFHTYSLIGLDLWYGLINKDDVISKTIFKFSLPNLINFKFFEMNVSSWSTKNPLWVLKEDINKLNLTITSDKKTLRYVYNIQYILCPKKEYWSIDNSSTLIQTLFKSNLNPIFETQHLDLWKIETG